LIYLKELNSLIPSLQKAFGIVNVEYLFLVSITVLKYCEVEIDIQSYLRMKLKKV
jgi:hypothetical protein